jgi:multiple sugar transport system substrate-binding protein
VTITDLIAVTGLTYGTGSRKVQKLIDDGLILKYPTSATNKSYSLLASAEYRQSFESCAHQIKAILAETVGQRDDSWSDDEYHFGEARNAISELLPPVTLRAQREGNDNRLKFLFHDDNYFTSMHNLWTDFRANASTRKDFTMLQLPHLYQTLLRNATLPESEFDIVAVNFPWLSEFASKGLIAPIDDLQSSSFINQQDFHSSVWQSGSWESKQFAIPLYVTVESLVARRDLFSAANLPYPKTLKDLIAAARKMHLPKRRQSGIVWNAARGMPIASAFMFLLGAHGGSVVTRGETERPRGSGRATAARWKAGLNTDVGRSTLRYMRQLLTVSPPDVLSYDWNRSMSEFMSGHASMGFIWTMRAARCEYDMLSKVKGRVEYLPYPNTNGVRRMVPIGGFVLAVPSNLSKQRAALAFQAIRWMTTSEAMKPHVRNGLPVAPRFSVSSDPEMAATSPIVGFVDSLARQDLLSSSMRPNNPAYTQIEEILGEEIHDALSGTVSDEIALARAQDRMLEYLIRQEKLCQHGGH